MLLNVFAMISLTVACGPMQAPEGRWDGMITFGTLQVPVVMHFEQNGNTLIGSFVNGDTRVTSTFGRFEDGFVQLTFPSGKRLQATLKDGVLSGTYGSGEQDLHAVTASKYCACGPVAEAGPDISGTWEVPDSDLRLTIRRRGDETLVNVLRPSGELGPIAGYFDGLAFMLNYFDGVHAAMLEIEQRKDHGLDLKFTEPGTEVKKYRAIQATIRN